MCWFAGKNRSASLWPQATGERIAKHLLSCMATQVSVTAAFKVVVTEKERYLPTFTLAFCHELDSTFW